MSVPSRLSRKNVVNSDDENEHPNQGSETRVDYHSCSRSPTPELRHDLPAGQLYKAARKEQQKRNAMMQECNEMRRKLADITNEDETAPARGRKKRKITEGGSEDETSEIKRLAHKFVNTYAIWLREPSETFKTKVDNDFDPCERFEDDRNKIQGQLLDLIDLLPEKYHGETLGSEWLIHTFHSEMNTQRSNTSTRARKQCGPAIFDCTDLDLVTSEARLAKFRSIIGYVAPDNSDSTATGRYDAFDVELLHKDWNGEFDVKTVFLNPRLLLTFSAIVRGPSSVAAMKANPQKIVPTSPKTVMRLWNLTKTTPGAIAATAIIARWAVSADDCLEARGAQTGIDWLADFEKYLHYLLDGLNKRKASILHIFRVWDDTFFPGQDGGLGGKTTDPEEESRMQSVWEKLNADEDEDESQAPDVE